MSIDFHLSQEHQLVTFHDWVLELHLLMSFCGMVCKIMEPPPSWSCLTIVDVSFFVSG